MIMMYDAADGYDGDAVDDGNNDNDYGIFLIYF
mgnify:CR=1 FL=1